MTKQKLKEAYLEWNRNIGKEMEASRSYLQQARDVVKSSGGHAYYNWKYLIIEASEVCNHIQIGKIIELYGERCRTDGKFDALRNLAIATNNFN